MKDTKGGGGGRVTIFIFFLMREGRNEASQAEPIFVSNYF